MKSLLPILLFATATLASCSSLPQEEVEALVSFREGEITRLNEYTATLIADVERLEAEILNIDAEIETLTANKAMTITEKVSVEAKIQTTQDAIEENQERLEELLD